MSAAANFGIILKELRRLRGLTQDDLALRTERSVDAVSQWERGVNWPNFETLVRLGSALGVPVRTFFERDHPELSEERAKLEIEANLLIAGFSDNDLSIAVEQMRALAKRNRIQSVS